MWIRALLLLTGTILGIVGGLFATAASRSATVRGPDCPPSSIGSGYHFTGTHMTLDITEVALVQNGLDDQSCPPYRPCQWKLNFRWSNVSVQVYEICLVPINCFSTTRCRALPANTSIDNFDAIVPGKCGERCQYDVIVRDSSGATLETLGTIYLHCQDCF